MIKIGILSTKENPLLINLIKEIKKIKEIKLFLLLAEISDVRIKKLNKIFKERTGSYFKKKKDKNFFFLNISKYLVNSHNSAETINIIRREKINYLYNGGTPNKLSNKIIKATKGIINIHPGLLPKYKGSSCVEWALYNGDPIGLTAHFMNKEYDSGPILKRKYIKFKKKKIKNYQDIRIITYLEQINFIKNILKIVVNNKIVKKKNIKNQKLYPVIPAKELNIIKKKIKNDQFIFNKKNLI